jgi:hypothetical protein
MLRLFATPRSIRRRFSSFNSRHGDLHPRPGRSGCGVPGLIALHASGAWLTFTQAGAEPFA